MTVRLDPLSRRSRWYRVPDDIEGQLAAMLGDVAFGANTDVDDAFVEWVDEHQPPTVDELDDLTLDEALTIAEVYGGGEFDGEMGDIVSALCVLRDHVREVTP